MHRQLKLFSFLILVTVFVGLFLRNITPKEIGELNGIVRHVVDGDSLFLNSTKKSIRLWGVDAPEKDEVGYAEATKTLTRLALKKAVQCVRIDADHYERIVARCYLRDDREINRLMIESGAASEYLYYTLGYYKWNKVPQ